MASDTYTLAYTFACTRIYFEIRIGLTFVPMHLNPPWQRHAAVWYMAVNSIQCFSQLLLASLKAALQAQEDKVPMQAPAPWVRHATWTAGKTTQTYESKRRKYTERNPQQTMKIIIIRHKRKNTTKVLAVLYWFEAYTPRLNLLIICIICTLFISNSSLLDLSCQHL